MKYYKILGLRNRVMFDRLLLRRFLFQKACSKSYSLVWGSCLSSRIQNFFVKSDSDLENSLSAECFHDRISIPYTSFIIYHSLPNYKSFAKKFTIFFQVCHKDAQKRYNREIGFLYLSAGTIKCSSSPRHSRTTVYHPFSSCPS